MRLSVFLLLILVSILGFRMFESFQNDAFAQASDFLATKFRLLSQASENDTNQSETDGGNGFNDNSNGLTPIDMIDEPLEPKVGGSSSSNDVEDKEDIRSDSARNSLNPNEQILIDELGKRREFIAAQEAEIQRKTALLTAAETQLIERQRALERLNETIQGLVAKYEDTQQEARTNVLSTYNVMKPRAAAAIFNELDIGVLVGVVNGMPARKLAQIMAEMNPLKASVLTTHLASTQLKLSDDQ